MNRFKFRAWDSRCDEFRYEDAPIYYEKDNGFHAGDEHSNGDWCDMPITQWTGLLDKNGKDIYEGDIISYKVKSGRLSYDEILEVKWGFGLFKLGRFYFTTMPGVDSSKTKQEFLEVIGNIYETPELMSDDTK